MASIGDSDESDGSAEVNSAYEPKNKSNSDCCSEPDIDISEMLDSCIKNSQDDDLLDDFVGSAVDDGELDDLVEEQLLVNKIREMQNARRNLDINRLQVIEIGNISSDENHLGQNLLVHERIDDDSDSLLEFMGESSGYNEERELKESLDKISKALTLNVLMQSELNRLEIYLEEKLTQNKIKQSDVKDKIKRFQSSDNPSGAGPKSWFTKFGMPYFKDIKRFPCGLNSDAKRMLSLDQILSFNNNHSRKWTLKEKHQMEEGIKKHLVSENIAGLQANVDILKEELSSTSCTKTFKEIKGKISSVEKKINNVKDQSLNYLFSKENPDREFDWLNISKEYVPNHSAVECERMWHIYIKPTVNKTLWTKQEDKKLLKSIDKFNKEDWDSIAKDLGTSRSSYQCFVNYQTRLADEIHKLGKWTEEEDDMLASLVAKCRVGKYIPWAKIAYYFHTRSVTQIYSRWTGSLNPDLKKGRFTRQEDRTIASYVRKFGENFGKISQMMGDRTSIQLRERYSRAIPARFQNVGRWSLDEDKLLVSLVSKYGSKNWSAISKQLVTRTRTQVRQRYKIIGSLVTKNSKIQLEDLHRGPMALSQNLLQPIQNISDEAEHKEAKSLSELIQEQNKEEAVIKKQNEVLIAKIKTGRRKIHKRNELDSKLINYFREAYSNEKLKFKTHYVKPDTDKAVNAMALFCQFLKAHVVLNEDKTSDIAKISTCTLRNIIGKMQKSFTNWGCNCLHPSSPDQFYLCYCHDQSSIDCIPVNAEATLVDDSEFLLSSLYKLNKPIEKQKCMCLSNKIKHFIPYYLPPNIITTILFRSILLIKDKIATSLSYDRKKRSGFFSKDDLEIQSIGLKKFTGYFSDEVDSSCDEESTDSEVKNDTCNIPGSDSTRNVNVNTSSESLPSTSSGRTSSVRVLFTSNDNSLPATASKNDLYSHRDKMNDCESFRRLTKKDAINLWKERLMSLLGWPIVLANQPPNFSSDFDSNDVNKQNTFPEGGIYSRHVVQNKVGRKRKQDVEHFLVESRNLPYRYCNATCGLFEDYPSVREFDLCKEINSHVNNSSFDLKSSVDQARKCQSGAVVVGDCKSNEESQKRKKNQKSVTKGNSLYVNVSVSKSYSKNKVKHKKATKESK